MNYKTISISPNKLTLDKDNPRFIVQPSSSEKDIIEYLLTYEEIIHLCNGINESRGLLVGERIVVYIENNKYIVAEGNRRTCACKLLLNPNLAPEKFRNKIPKAHQDTLKNIINIDIDIVDSRETAMASMGTKHINGIKQWSSYSKMQYYALQFNSGKSIHNISKITKTSTSSVVTNIKNYNLIEYTKNIKHFTKEEIKYLFNFLNSKIKISIFTKALTLTFKNTNYKGKSISSLLGLEYDSKTYFPKSSLNKYFFDKCLYIIAKNSLDPTIKFDTRSNIDDLPELLALLDEYYSNPNSFDLKYKNTNPENNYNQSDDTIISGNNDKQHDNSTNFRNNDEQSDNTTNFRNNDNQSDDTIISENNDKQLDNATNFRNNDNQSDDTIISENNDKQPDNTTNFRNNDNQSDNNSNDQSTINKKTIKRPKINGKKRSQPEKFFTTLCWQTVDISNNNNFGLINLCDEIQRVSKSKDYLKYPISSAMLCRNLFEQTLIYYLKKKNKYDAMVKKNGNRPPTLDSLIKYYSNNLDNLFDDSAIKRTFKSFADSSGNKDYFDMVVHHPHLVKPEPNNLDAIANMGLRGFIHFILNN